MRTKEAKSLKLPTITPPFIYFHYEWHRLAPEMGSAHLLNIKFWILSIVSLHMTHGKLMLIFLYNTIIYSGKQWLVRSMQTALVPHSTNHEFIFSEVVLTIAQMGKHRTPFKIEFMHSARFIVIYSYLFPPS